VKQTALSRVALAVAMLAILVLLCGPLAAAEQPVYARIAVSPKTTVYIQFFGPKMRAATSVPGLKSAKIVDAKDLDRQGLSENDYAQFPEVTLPVPAKQLPAGFTKMTAQFDVMRSSGRRPSGVPESYVYGSIGLSKPDKAKANWTYTMSVSQEGAASPVDAKPIRVPAMSNLALDLTAKVAGKKVGAGLTLKAGALEVGDIRKNGKSADAEVRILDSSGKVVDSSKGPIGKFGFT